MKTSQIQLFHFIIVLQNPKTFSLCILKTLTTLTFFWSSFTPDITHSHKRLSETVQPQTSKWLSSKVLHTFSGRVPKRHSLLDLWLHRINKWWAMGLSLLYLPTTNYVLNYISQASLLEPLVTHITNYCTTKVYTASESIIPYYSTI